MESEGTDGGAGNGSVKPVVRKYRHRPILVEAVQYDGTPETRLAIGAWLGAEWHANFQGRVEEKDWLVVTEMGEVYVVPHAIFQFVFEVIPEKSGADVLHMAQARDDSTLWIPENALRDLLKRIETGEAKPTALAVHYYERTLTGGRIHRWHASGLTYPEHIALLQVATFESIRDWGVAG